MKIKKYVQSHKKQLAQLLLVVGIGIAISAIFLLIFLLTGVFYFDNGFHFNAELFAALRDNPMLYIVYVLVEAICCTLLCMNPIGSGVFVWLGIALFGANWKCFLAAFAGCFLSYIMIDALGRFGGAKLIKRIIGEEEYSEIEDLINKKGYTYIPIIYIMPIFPDDLTCLVVGTLKFNWWFHMLSAFIGKAVGIATVVFGVSLIPTQLFLPISVDKLYNWFVLIACIIVYVTVLFKAARWIDKKISTWLEKRQKEKNNEQQRLDRRY